METLLVVLVLAAVLALVLPVAFFFYIAVVLALMVGWSFGRAWGWATLAATLSLSIYAVSLQGDHFPLIGWALVAAPLVLWRPVVGYGRRKRIAERAALIEAMRAKKNPRRPLAGATGARLGDGFGSAVRYVKRVRSRR